MRHARTGAVKTAEPVRLDQLLQPPVVIAEVHAEALPAFTQPGASAEPARSLDPWTWPEAPGLPSSPTLQPTAPGDTPAVPSHARVLPAADRAKRSLPRLRSFRGPSPVERYGVPPTASPAEPSSATTATQGPLVGLLAAVVAGAGWIALAGLTGLALGVMAVVLGAAVGAATHRFGRRGGDENVFFATLWAILGSTAGFFVVAVQANMDALGVGAGDAIAGSRWDDIVSSVVTAPLNWVYVALSATVAVYLVRRAPRS